MSMFRIQETRGSVLFSGGELARAVAKTDFVDGLDA